MEAFCLNPHNPFKPLFRNKNQILTLCLRDVTLFILIFETVVRQSKQKQSTAS